jgi:TRAP transporter TAXI family solute receptor
MRWRTLFRAFAPIALLGAMAALVPHPRELARAGGSRVHLSIATGGTGGVWYPYGGGLARVIGRHVRNTDATAEVTAASVDNLNFLRAGTADLAFTMADALADATTGSGAFRETGPVPALAIAWLYTNHLHLVARAGLGISRVADLRGHVVSVGSPGSGIEAVAVRVLEAAGLDPVRDIRRHGLGASQAVDALRDGKLDAFFWLGGVPTGAILDLAGSRNTPFVFVPTDDVLPKLTRFGYFRSTIPAGVYPGFDTDVPTIGVSNVLVVHRSMSDALAYEITRALFEHREELIAVHPEARHLDPRRATSNLPVPLHPGAARYYREVGVIR